MMKNSATACLCPDGASLLAEASGSTCELCSSCRSANLWTAGFTLATLVGAIVGGATHSAVGTGANIAIGFGVGLAIFLFCTAAAYVTRSDQDMSAGDWLRIVICAGTHNLRSTFKHNTTRFDRHLHIATFDIFLKCAAGSAPARRQHHAAAQSVLGSYIHVL
jgi:hypothetical protein